MNRRYRYPDIDDIVARKAKGRGARARLSFGEKLEILDKLRDDVAPIVRARQARIRALQENSVRGVGAVD
jgi:hypothetical protein